MSTTQLMAAQKGLQLLCCDLPSSAPAAAAPAKLSEDLLKMNSYLSTVCRKYLDQDFSEINSRKFGAN